LSRDDYGSRQAELLAALQRRGPTAARFAADDLAAAAASLLRKRSGAVADAWPALRHALGDEFEELFGAFARASPPPEVGEGYADGFAFAGTIPRTRLDDAARAELLLARAELTVTGRTPVPRKTPFLGALWLHHPPRLLIAARLPGGRPRHATIPARR
jgi:hypothetical protein